jgi:hypothetical protein
MDRANRLLGDGQADGVLVSPRYFAEYDHPFQRIMVDFLGEVHIIDDRGNSVCGRVVGSGSNSGWCFPSPCSRCFMHGDLLALRISYPKYTEMEEAESWPQGYLPFDLDSQGAMAGVDAQLGLGSLAGLLMGADPWR